MALSNDELKAILLEQSYVSQEDITTAEKDAEERGLSLKQSLFELELLNQALYDNAIAEHYQLPYFDAANTTVDPAIVEDLPEAISRAFSSVVVARPDVQNVTIVTADPGNKKLDEAIRLNLDQEEAVFPEDDTKGDKKEKKPNVVVIFVDDMGFAVMGRVVDGMDVADALYADYGESAGGGIRGGQQDPVFDGGNHYLDQNYPNLDRIIRATIIPVSD